MAPDVGLEPIKESISAVEAAALALAGEMKNIKLSSALKKLPDLHGALRNAFISLYGYTSDEPGIRHSLETEQANVGEAEARFMIIACSAFVNYLRDKAV